MFQLCTRPLPFVCLIAALGFAFTASQAQADLIGHWTFDTNFNDSSVNANHGTAAGGASIVSDSQFGGGALSLNGSAQYVSVPDIAAYTAFETGSKTISAWLKPASVTSRRTIFSTRTFNPAGSFAFEYGAASGGSGRLAVTTPNAWNAETSGPVGSVVVDQWQHVLFVRTGNDTDPGNQRIYHNGVLQTLSSDAPVATLDNGDAKLIGAERSNLHFVSGLIDDVGIWQRDLTHGEARALYTLGLSEGQNGSQFDFNYDLGTAELLFELHASQAGGAVAIGVNEWSFASGFDATGFEDGDLFSVGSDIYLVLAGGGTLNATGVAIVAIIPEPSSFMLLCLGGVPLLNRRRGRSGRR